MSDVVKRDLGSVVGPRGMQGERGENYTLTNEDKNEIAGLVADYDFIRNVPIIIKCVDDYSGQPIYATINLKNSDNNVIETSGYQQGEYTFMAPPMFNYKINFDAPGYNAVSDIVISGLPKTGFTQTVRFVPSSITTFTVDYKVNGVVVQHNVVQPHGSVSYQGEDISESGKIWTGWDDASGNGRVTDVVEDMVIQPTFCVPEQPAEIKDMALYDYIYSDYDSDNMAYTQAEFAWIMLNGAAKTYLAIGQRCKIKLGGWTVTADDTMIIQLEAFNHFKLTGSSDFALTAWLAYGVLLNGRRINPTNDSSTGWADSELNGLIDTTYKPQFPPFWRGLMKKVQMTGFKKWFEAGELKTGWSTTERYLWLPSYTEMFGGTEEPYYSEVDADAETKQFPYYTSSALRIKKTYNGYGSAQSWWLRSPSATDSSSFRFVGNGGVAYSYGASTGNSLALGFCI